MTTVLAIAVPPLARLWIDLPDDIALCVGLVLTYWVNPDLDLNYVVRGLFRIYWWPYSRLLHHRSIWSHFPVISTFIRLAYLGWALLLLPTDWRIVFFVFVGMAISDFFHWVLDWPVWHAILPS